MTFGGRSRHHADPNTAFDEPADGIEAAQLNTQPEPSADLLCLFRQKALQRTCSVETDKIEVERLGKGDMPQAPTLTLPRWRGREGGGQNRGQRGQRMLPRDHED